ncbi:MAG: TatD family hydrolase [Candidatus Woykebacteria bacterium]
MNLIDTHAHLQFKAYDGDRDEVTKRNSKELEALINVGTSVDASEKSVKLSEQFDNFFASVAVHPHHVGQWSKETYQTLESLGKRGKVVAVGEIGLDKHVYKNYRKPNLKAQVEILEQQINLAGELGKPILFHCRDAYDEIYNQIKKYKGKTTGLMHCYMGSWEQTKNFLDLGLYISFSGNITYKGNDYIRDVAKKLPDNRILTETDSPFLSPKGRRGKRNEPIYVKMVAVTIADLKGWSLEKAAKITAQNARNLFNFHK